MDMPNSARTIDRASYVVAKFTPAEQREHDTKPGGAVLKMTALGSLGLNHDQLRRLGALRGFSSERDRNKIVEVMNKAVERNSLTLGVEGAQLSAISWSSIREFVHQALVLQGRQSDTSIIDEYTAIAPIGRLHLEKLEMYPVGIERGELVFTVPMAPQETVAISHKEWTVSGREYEDIVQDYLETYSEHGVTEKTDASLATENQSSHSSSLSFGASVTGSYTGVTVSTTLGLSSTSSDTASLKRTIQDSRQVTEKASARSRQEHKVSVKIETKSGVEDITFKTIVNNSNQAVRIDYYKMMRKWKTKLLRYGLRQTYDIAIPLPGARIWSHHRRLRAIDQILEQPFQFDISPSAIDAALIASMEDKYDILLEKAPPQSKTIYADWVTPEFFNYNNTYGRVAELPFDVPDGYTIDTQANIVNNHALSFIFNGWSKQNPYFILFNIGINQSDNGVPYGRPFSGYSDLAALRDRSGHQTLTFIYGGISAGAVSIVVPCRLTADAYQDWQRRVWGQAKAAAELAHNQQLAQLRVERDELYAKLVGTDTLRLRRLEREELVRSVLAWLMGPAIRVDATDTTTELLQRMEDTEDYLNGYVAPDQAQPAPMDADEWRIALQQGELTKFLNTAVEWENILYFLYPYFWGSVAANPDRMLFQHPDPEHERFVRAGYARIVLPIRPGFETDFSALMERGSLPEDADHPYVTVAAEIENFARTNYGNIPPANPERSARPLLYPKQRQTWDTIQAAVTAVETYRKTEGSLPADLAELPGGHPNDAWGRPLRYDLPGQGADFDIYSYGADDTADVTSGAEDVNADISTSAAASLVATWFDYTPSSGIDIETNTQSEHMG